MLRAFEKFVQVVNIEHETVPEHHSREFLFCYSVSNEVYCDAKIRGSLTDT
jgi:hypothetical protein